MVRWLAVGLVLVAAAPTSRAEVQVEGWLLRDEPLVGAVTLSVMLSTEQPGVTVSRGAGDERLPETPLQVWVLRSDGTALQRRNPAEPVLSFGTGSNNWRAWYTIIPVEPATQRELSAVVVSLDGALFVRPISRKPAN